MSRIRPAKFVHVVYRTHRYDEMIAWYQKVFDANAFMKGPGFDQNPIGVEFDPDDLVKRLRAGEPASNFLVRTVHQPVAPLRNPVTA